MISKNQNKKIKKEFVHKEVEICNLCEKPIYTNEDNWVALIDYTAKTETILKFYHRKCLNDLMKGSSKILEEKFKKKLGGFVKGILGKGGINKENFQEILVSGAG